VIRPLAYCRERDLERFAKARHSRSFPAISAAHRKTSQRVNIKRMLADWERQYPGRTETIFRAIGNVAPSQLADRTLFDFAGLNNDAGSAPEAGTEAPQIRAINL
jgi:tRNA 2-thiocytidine biosynthesis protein TtcA